jgi:glycosyltransferase involved in cell wall biosynthesis
MGRSLVRADVETGMGRTISVVIPTHNRARLLVRAVESALAQTHAPDEIIVVDDGSMDDTAAMMGALIEAKVQNSPRIYYFVQQRKGPSAARNRGIAEARGDWIAFLDSDDLWYPEKLKRQFDAIEGFQGKFGACYTDVRFTNNPSIKETAFSSLKRNYTEQVGVFSNPRRHIVCSGHTIFVQSLVVRTALVKAVGGFDESLFLGEDQDFTFRLAVVSEFCYVNRQLVEVDRAPRREIGMIELFDDAAIRLQQRQLRNQKWLELCEQHEPEIKQSLTKFLSAIHSEWATLFLAKGEYSEAAKSMDKAVRYRCRVREICKWLLVRFTPNLVRRVIAQKKASAT